MLTPLQICYHSKSRRRTCVCLGGSLTKQPICATLQITEQQETTASGRKGLRSPGLCICGGLFCSQLQQQREDDPNSAKFPAAQRGGLLSLRLPSELFLLFYKTNSTLTELLTLRCYFCIKHFNPLLNIPSENISAHELSSHTADNLPGYVATRLLFWMIQRCLVL